MIGATRRSSDGNDESSANVTRSPGTTAFLSGGAPSTGASSAAFTSASGGLGFFVIGPANRPTNR